MYIMILTHVVCEIFLEALIIWGFNGVSFDRVTMCQGILLLCLLLIATSKNILDQAYTGLKMLGFRGLLALCGYFTRKKNEQKYR